MSRDTEIFQLIDRELSRQREGIELIASENFTSHEVIQAMGSCLTNKYAEGYPGKRYYGGCEVVDQVEQLAIDRLKELFGAAYANVQPHSGAQANAAVFLATLQAGDKILGFDLSHGGHLSHGSPVNFSGKVYNATFYGVEKETGRIDMDKVAAKTKAENPKLIICGDYNICHEAIDIHDPVRNKNVSGFLPVEREWIGNFMANGFVDSFRHLNKEPDNYTWWSYRANSRANNKGWRLDYGMVSEPLKDNIKRAVILSEAKHSDHCPILIEIE